MRVWPGFPPANTQVLVSPSPFAGNEIVALREEGISLKRPPGPALAVGASVLQPLLPRAWGQGPGCILEMTKHLVLREAGRLLTGGAATAGSF